MYLASQAVRDDFDFGGMTSLDDVNLLLRYYQIYSSADPMDVDDATPPEMEFEKWLKQAQDRVTKLPNNEVERKAAVGDLEMKVELGLRCVLYFHHDPRSHIIITMLGSTLDIVPPWTSKARATSGPTSLTLWFNAVRACS